jgi:hypothetical protein
MSSFKKISFTVALAVLVWLIPFVASIPFFNTSGVLVVNFWLFKLIMVLCLCLVTFFGFRLLHKKLIENTILLSVYTIIINTLLDILILIPIAKYSITDYILQIFSIYIIFIPVSIYFSKKQLKN